MAGRGPPDNTLAWCMEGLMETPLVSDTTIFEIFSVLFPGVGETAPPIVRCRLMLRCLCNAATVDSNTLDALRGLSTIVSQSAAELSRTVNLAQLTPPTELLLQVKTEIVVQSWRQNAMATPQDILATIQHTFGPPPLDNSEISRHDQLIQASSDPGMRIHFEHVSNASNVLSGVLRFAAMAQAALGKSVLGIIQDDINAGRYHPGQPAVLQLGSQPALMARSMDYSHPHPYPAPQQAPRAIAVPVYPLPHHIPITAQDYSSYQAYSPPAAGHGGTGAFGGTLAITPRLPQLDQVRQNLRGAGGVDPLPAMLEHAERAVAAAGRMAPGMHQNGGVPVTWSASPGDADFKARPALPVSAGRAAPPPSLGRQQFQQPAGRRSTGGGGGSANRVPTTGARRKTVRWLPHEVDLLLALTREHGPGSWAAILSAANGQLGDRTQVDLKDKWRNLTRSLNPEAVAIQEEHAAAEALGQFQNEEHILQGGGGDEEMQDEAGEEQEQQYQYNQNQEQGEAQEQQTEPQQEEEAAAEEAAEENGEGEEPSPPKKRRGRSQRKRSG